MKHAGMATNNSSASFEAQSGSGLSPHHARLMVRDPGVLAIIAGQGMRHSLLVHYLQSSRY